ncbi:MAG TPA: hypothetical protein VII99_00920 [Bacteroidia bacterium]
MKIAIFVASVALLAGTASLKAADISVGWGYGYPTPYVGGYNESYGWGYQPYGRPYNPYIRPYAPLPYGAYRREYRRMDRRYDRRYDWY